jgi:hypothetical protein
VLLSSITSTLTAAAGTAASGSSTSAPRQGW